jgi:photosystem II P680 reaction center D1 protein
MHGSLVTSSLIRETENESQRRLQIRSRRRNLHIVAAHGYWSNLPIRFIQQLSFITLFLAAWPVVCIWFTALGISTMAFNLNGFNFNQSIVDSQGRVLKLMG